MTSSSGDGRMGGGDTDETSEGGCGSGGGADGEATMTSGMTSDSTAERLTGTVLSGGLNSSTYKRPGGISVTSGVIILCDILMTLPPDLSNQTLPFPNDKRSCVI